MLNFLGEISIYVTDYIVYTGTNIMNCFDSKIPYRKNKR